MTASINPSASSISHIVTTNDERAMTAEEGEERTADRRAMNTMDQVLLNTLQLRAHQEEATRVSAHITSDIKHTLHSLLDMSAVNRHILSKAIAEMSASNNNSVRLYDPQDTLTVYNTVFWKVPPSFRLTFTCNGPLAARTCPLSPTTKWRPDSPQDRHTWRHSPLLNNIQMGQD
ncbi:hypothetical protein B9Z55_000116 [Caenorhabditis nigoni]|uniref:Uncharacterized protein n=1 Tax=Caenorhabditis nigoni TaxID=1611254 RepID=A0A2G5VED1_9PELO|nr:hypothetical protein B9Z55_000116 [Caenorhabditis nigoni]